MSLKMDVPCDAVPCSLVGNLQRSSETYCLHHQAMVMEATRSAETLVRIYKTTRHSITEQSHLHTCSSESLKPQLK